MNVISGDKLKFVPNENKTKYLVYMGASIADDNLVGSISQKVYDKPEIQSNEWCNGKWYFNNMYLICNQKPIQHWNS